jgi:RimJ/RimL family protein N-acetyltransferase
LTALLTPRLELRQWRDSDLEAFAALNADPAVMELMPRCLTRAESDEFARHARKEIEWRGWGLWAVEVKETAAFAGCVGLSVPAFQAHFTPCIGIDWRLSRVSWGHGYATEAAKECLRFAFEQLRPPEVVSFTVPANVRSRAVMQRLGMTHDARDDFDHPQLPAQHPLQRHVLYRLSREAWKGATAPGG